MITTTLNRISAHSLTIDTLRIKSAVLDFSIAVLTIINLIAALAFWLAAQ